MKSKWSKVLIIAVFIIAVFMVAWGRIESNLEGLKDMPVARIDLKDINNGIYVGSYSVFPVSVEVNVMVEDHAITAIDLKKHTNGQGKAAEAILGEVVAAQSLAVDVVTGATYSSRVILKAIENALLSAGKQQN